MALRTVANPAPEYTPPAKDIKAVTAAVEDMYHHMVTIYKLMSGLDIPCDCKFEKNLIATKVIAQCCAQRLDACATKLSGRQSGYYENEFGML